jgi:hypothetical protein
LPVSEHDRHVGFANDDRACGFKAFDGGRRSRTVRLRERGQAPGVGGSAIRERFLDCDGQAMKRAEQVLARTRFICLLGPRNCLLAILPNDRVQLRIVAIDPLKRHVHELGRRYRLPSDRVGRFARGQERRREITRFHNEPALYDAPVHSLGPRTKERTKHQELRAREQRGTNIPRPRPDNPGLPVLLDGVTEPADRAADGKKGERRAFWQAKHAREHRQDEIDRGPFV